MLGLSDRVDDNIQRSARNKLVKFSRLWGECSQEEARIAAREENVGSKDQALTVHSKKGRIKPHYSKGKSPHSNTRKDLSRFRCYTCDEKGHFAKDCPKSKNHSNKKKINKRRHHAHAAEDDESSRKRSRYEREDSSSEDEYVLISALIGLKKNLLSISALMQKECRLHS